MNEQTDSEPVDAETNGAAGIADIRHWRLNRDDDGIAWLHFDCAEGRTNVLSSVALEELDRCLEVLEREPPAGLAVVSDKATGFAAGADVSEFTQLEDESQALTHIRRAQGIFDRLEKLGVPSVCVIHGYCFGGGLELALACRYRIALDEPGTRMGLPEVRLGIHPGYGGTVRLPMRVGDFAALDWMLSGRSLRARPARRAGLVDYAIPRRQLGNAVRSILTRPPTPRRASRWRRIPSWAPLRPAVARYLRQRVQQRAPAEHYPAPHALLDLWQTHAGNRRAMQEAEAASVAHLLLGDTARNLVRVFFLQERMKSLGRGHDFHAEHVHVVGAGTMGSEIAAWCAARDLKVSIQDQDPARIAPAVQHTHQVLTKRLKDPLAVQTAMDRFIPDPKGAAVHRADVVIEAVYEDPAVKHEVLGRLETQLKPGALLATNTSSIPLEELGEALEQPGRLVGLHFFNPVDRMQLVEVVGATNTESAALKNALGFTRQIDRLPLRVRSTPGFLVNRVLMPYLLEAVILLEEGIPGIAIDQAAVAFGMPMGPIELADTVGLDVCRSVAGVLTTHFGGQVPTLLARRVDAGAVGRKAGTGFYTWRRGKPLKSRAPRQFTPPPDLQDRLLLPLINEAVRCLREGVVEDADLADAGVIFGTGFAPFRGGPLRYTENEGAAALKARLQTLEQHYGDRFRPDAGWESLE